MVAGMRSFVRPRVVLVLEVLDALEAPQRQEACLEVVDGALDLAGLIPGYLSPR
jgi:hypothetical protein